jgi:hypothetical protein
MQYTLYVSSDLIEIALKRADDAGSPATLHGLSAPIYGGLMARADALWEQIKEELTTTYSRARDQTQEILHKLGQSIDDLLKLAGNKARDVSEYLLAKLREYITAIVDGMLRQVRSEITIGSTTLPLAQIELSERIVLGGSLKTSLADTFELTSNGELAVAASYGLKSA